MSNALQIFKSAGVNPRLIKTAFGGQYEDIINSALKGGGIGALAGGGLEAVFGRGREGETGRDKAKRILGGALKGTGLGAAIGGGWTAATNHLPTSALMPEPPKSEQITKALPKELLEQVPKGMTNELGVPFGHSHPHHALGELVMGHKVLGDNVPTLALGAGGAAGIHGFLTNPDRPKLELAEMMDRFSNTNNKNFADPGLTKATRQAVDALVPKLLTQADIDAIVKADPTMSKETKRALAKLLHTGVKQSDIDAILKTAPGPANAELEGLIGKMRSSAPGGYSYDANREFLKKVAPHLSGLPRDHKEQFEQLTKQYQQKYNMMLGDAVEKAWEDVYGHTRDTMTDVAHRGGMYPRSYEKAQQLAKDAIRDLERSDTEQTIVNMLRRGKANLGRGLTRGGVIGLGTAGLQHLGNDMLADRKESFGSLLNDNWKIMEQSKGKASPQEVIEQMKQLYPKYDWGNAAQAPEVKK